MDLSQESERSHLKENVLATKLEGVVGWVVENRPKVLTGLGVILALILFSSVLVLRQKEQREIAWTRLAQAQAYMGGKQWEGAKQILNDLKKTQVNSLVTLFSSYYLGEIAINEKNFEEAISNYSFVIAQAGDNPIKPLAMSALGFVYEEKSDFQMASTTYQQLIDQYSDHFLAARTQLALGRSQLLSGKKEEAKKSLGQLVDLYPNSEWAKMARQLMDKP